jgi:hypothetical protein
MANSIGKLAGNQAAIVPPIAMDLRAWDRKQSRQIAGEVGRSNLGAQRPPRKRAECSQPDLFIKL